uniref:Uncharacterized protein n=1 Tax=Romanomermis culicivorax TaxID=13658 RepID=A0A915J3R5_ROMCU
MPVSGTIINVESSTEYIGSRFIVFRVAFYWYVVVRRKTRVPSPTTIIVFSFSDVVLALQLRGERSLRIYGDHFGKEVLYEGKV